MLPEVCQLKTLLFVILFFSIGCASKKIRHQVDDHELIAMQEPKWFKTNEAHSLRDREGKPVPHLFFDVAPELSRDQRFANVVITTPQDSPHAYQLDLNSGQRHYSHSYCSQKDAWNKESGNFNRPPFNIGYLPRVLDQLGSPQKVVVVTNSQKNMAIDVGHYRARIVGAFVEQSCNEGNCLGKDNWSSRLVLLGVEATDPDFKGINDEEVFKKKYKWDQLRAHLENLDGRSFMADRTYPLVRIRSLFSFQEAFEYFKKNSVYITDPEIKKIQNGCHALYDKLWKDVGAERPEDKAANTVTALNDKIRLREELKKKQQPFGFAARFKDFAIKYGDEMATCEKFVYHGNINLNPEVFWFYSYVGIYFRLNKEGYFYDCRKKAWQQNVVTQQGVATYNLKRDIVSCSEKDIDTSMNYIPNFLKSLKGSKYFYRFVDYDTHAFGSHRKLYSWVRQTTRKYDCSGDPNREIVRDLEVFPDDVTWKPRNVVDIEEELKVIY